MTDDDFELYLDNAVMLSLRAGPMPPHVLLTLCWCCCALRNIGKARQEYKDHIAFKRIRTVKGIGSSSSAWKAVALPLSYTRKCPKFRPHLDFS